MFLKILLWHFISKQCNSGPKVKVDNPYLVSDVRLGIIKG